MPWGDGTGPMGRGPGTGWGRGFCRRGPRAAAGRGRGPGPGWGWFRWAAADADDDRSWLEARAAALRAQLKAVEERLKAQGEDQASR